MTTDPLELARRVLEHAKSSARIQAETGVTLARALLSVAAERDELRRDLRFMDDKDRLRLTEIATLTAERDELRAGILGLCAIALAPRDVLVGHIAELARIAEKKK